MNHLLRPLAPITTAGAKALDDEARQVLATSLAARRIVDFSGPRGWDHSATNLGRVTVLDESPGEGVAASRRVVLPLVELRAEFVVSRAAIDDAERGARKLDLDGLDTAANAIAAAENVAVFHGFAAAQIAGITEVSAHQPINLGTDFPSYPRHVAKAVEVLRSAGVDGPYALALSPQSYTGVVETSEHGGVLLFEHLRQILGGPIVWAPGVRGAVVASMRGGDFFFDCGGDLSLGYRSHDEHDLHLYIEESFSFHVASPEAAIALVG